MNYIEGLGSIVTGKNSGDFLSFAAKCSERILLAMVEALTHPSSFYEEEPPVSNTQRLRAICVADWCDQHDIASALCRKLRNNLLLTVREDDIRTFREVVKSSGLGGKATADLDCNIGELESDIEADKMRKPKRGRRIDEQTERCLTAYFLA